MTSEVVVMNQRSVAVAADAALSLVGQGRIVTRTGERKLFRLLPDHNVAVVFYGRADIAGHLWEHLFEGFAEAHRGAAFPTVRALADAFAGWLDGRRDFFPAEAQRNAVREHVSFALGYVVDVARRLLEGQAAANEGQALGEAVRRILADLKRDDLPRLPCFPANFESEFIRIHGPDIDDMLAKSFGKAGLPPELIARLREIVLLSIVRDVFIEPSTGIVFAGFGRDERYPADCLWHVSTVAGGIAKRRFMGETRIAPEQRSALNLYAQSDTTRTLLFGIAPDVEAAMIHLMLNAGFEIGRETAAASDGAKREGLMKALPPLVNEKVLDAYQQLRIFIDHRHIEPLRGVIEVAQGEELISIARMLVELNGFKQRITGAAETVGGETAVALITRDRFVLRTGDA